MRHPFRVSGWHKVGSLPTFPSAWRILRGKQSRPAIYKLPDCRVIIGLTLGIPFTCLTGPVEISPCFWEKNSVRGGGGGDLALLVKAPINVFLPLLSEMGKHVFPPKLY